MPFTLFNIPAAGMPVPELPVAGLPVTGIPVTGAQSSRQSQKLHSLFSISYPFARRVMRGGILAALLFAALPAKIALSQVVEPPNPNFLFFEDQLERKKSKKKKKEIQQRQSQVMKKAKEAGFPYDVNAKTIKYDSANKKLIGEGGVIIGYASSIIESERGEIGTESKTAVLEGDVRVSDFAGSIAAEQMTLKLDDGTGFFKNADLYFEDGNYRIVAEEVSKVGKDDFEFRECSLTTCECPESEATDPWRIEGKRGEIEREGYGTIHDGIIYAYNVPVLYSPYLKFPVKTKRATGFLPGSFGGGQRSGFSFTLPFYMNIDESTDATVTPVYNSRARIGVDNEFRKVFSDDTVLDMGGLYFNESIRNENDLLGIDPSGYLNRNDQSQKARKGVLNDLTGVDRYAGYLNFTSMNHKLFGEDLQFLVRGRGVSDDILLREYNRPEIAPYNTRFVTSRATVRYNFLDDFTLDTAAEYNQAMFDNDRRVPFQRLPDVSLQGIHVLRPFGENPYGAKLVLNDQVSNTLFKRRELYDGNRAEILETASIPLHYKNILDLNLSTDLRATQYSLDNTQSAILVPVTQPDGSVVNEEKLVNLPDSSDRIVPGFTAQASSTLEKVYDVGESNPLKYLAELGTRGRNGELQRVKHTLEPGLRYRFVPQVDQSDNPQFDSFDRLPRRNLVTYSLMQRFFGRYEGRDPNIYGIEETTPEAADLGVLSSRTPIDQAFDLGMQNSADAFYRPSTSFRPELLNFVVLQTYDFNIARTEEKKAQELYGTGDPFSDISMRSNFIPNEYFRLTGGGSFDPETLDPSGYDIGGQFMDKRGDQLRMRLSFTDGSSGPVRQSETSAEVRLSDRFALGFYGRYDDVQNKFLEKKVGFRLNSACRCWMLDFDIWDRINPDQTQFQVTLTLNGVTQLGSNLFTQRPNASGATP